MPPRTSTPANYLQTRLPSEMVALIFSYVAPTAVLKHVRLCRRIRSCLSTRHFALQSLRRHAFPSALTAPPKTLFLGIDLAALLAPFVALRSAHVPHPHDSLARLWFRMPAAFQEAFAELYLCDLSVFHAQNWAIGTAIPEALGRCVNLTRLVFAKNNLKGGIPAFVSQLLNLRALFLVHCGLVGELPASLGQLTLLEELVLVGNQLTGAIPVEWETMARLRVVNLEGNALSECIPGRVLAGWHNTLQVLNVSKNRFSGILPHELWRHCTSLEQVHVDENNLEGDAVPAGIGKLTRLQKWDCSGNIRMGGVIADELCVCLMLREVGLAQIERLRGPLPVRLGDLGSLIEMKLEGTPGLVRLIPATVGRESTLHAVLTRLYFPHYTSHCQYHHKHLQNEFYPTLHSGKKA
ncbi:hypothetical protein BC830DRAFT_1234711 [Chytriomyces sp. MP71]|nr:hypothetical protein BC830DRAFT_1234711 [Chytriomyces sp. MP71]